MNSSSSLLENLNASNRAMGLFAGVTSEAYERLGFGHSGASLLDTLLKAFLANTPSVESSADEGVLPAWVDYSLRSAPNPDLLAVRTAILEDENPGALQALAESVPLPLGAMPASPPPPSSMDDLQDWSNAAVLAPADLSALGSSSLGSELGASVEQTASSVFDLLTALSTESADLSGGFDGERQRLIRDFIDDVGERSGSGIREFLQTEVRGELKGALQGAVDSVGIEALDPVSDPVFAVDYYGESANIINGTLESSSLSSVALPPLGPTFTAMTDPLIPH